MKNIEVLKKFLTLTGWRQFFGVLSKKEKIIFFAFLFSTLVSGFSLSTNLYYKNTKIVPTEGGRFVEGVAGYPRFINPIYAEAADVDRDLTQLVFSGLMKYGPGGEIVADLAKEYKILEGGRVYEFYLRDDAFWHDGKKITSDDVIFTIKTIQNPEIKSPLLPNWLGVEVEKIDWLGVRFKLKEPYSAFLERATVKIAPEHIWKDAYFPWSNYNLKPVGSGPYQFKDLEIDEQGKISSLELTLNKKYFGKLPKISQILFKFYDSESDLVKAADSGDIDGFSLTDYGQSAPNSRLKLYPFSLMRYFAVFFNPTNAKILAEKEVREALNYGMDKKEILEKALNNRGGIVDSPLLPEIYGLKSPTTTYEFNLDKAKEILDKAGFVDKDSKRRRVIKKESAFQFKNNLKEGSEGKEVEELQKCLARDKEVYPLAKIDGRFDSLTKNAVIRFQEKYGLEKSGNVLTKTRAKLNEVCFEIQEEITPLKLTLTTADQAMLKESALILKEQWEKLGAEVEIKTINIKDLEADVIKPRDYEALLFGEVLGRILDPFPFWHSSQREFGLNLADYKNKRADELMEEARVELNGEERIKKYEELQEIIMEDMPALFLYNPDYLYFVSREIKGIEGEDENRVFLADPSGRFSGIENWYIKTKRVLK